MAVWKTWNCFKLSYSRWGVKIVPKLPQMTWGAELVGTVALSSVLLNYLLKGATCPQSWLSLLRPVFQVRGLNLCMPPCRYGCRTDPGSKYLQSPGTPLGRHLGLLVLWAASQGTLWECGATWGALECECLGWSLSHCCWGDKNSSKLEKGDERPGPLL